MKEDKFVASPTSFGESYFVFDKVLDLSGQPNGLKDISNLYPIVPTSDQDVIEQAFVAYLLGNSLVSSDVSELLLEVLVEMFIENMASVDDVSGDLDESCAEINIVDKMTKK